MSFFGVDISKYQAPSAMDGWDFAIFNVEDPYIGAKVDHAYETNKNWNIYKWQYPTQSGLYSFQVAKHIVDGLYRGGRYPQFFLDYEESGVAPWQRDEWYHACQASGIPQQPGFYNYLYLMRQQGLSFYPDETGWLAYYPGNNDGNYYDSMSDTARAYGATLHQYSSTSGTLDRNVTLDDSWFTGGGVPDMTEDEVRRIVEDHVYGIIPQYGVSRADAHVQDYVFNSHDPYPSRFVGYWFDVLIKAKAKVKETLGITTPPTP